MRVEAKMVSIRKKRVFFAPEWADSMPSLRFAGTIRLWQTTPGKTYGLWQGSASQNGQYA